MKGKNIIFWSLVCCGTFIFLRHNFSFLFYYSEQLQLFLFTKQYANVVIFHPGGLSLYLSRFLVQFFIYPEMGALLTTLLLVGTGFLVQQILSRISSCFMWGVLSLLPSFALLIMHLDINYLLQGTVSFLLMSLAGFIYTRIKSVERRIPTGALLIPLLFFTAGPVCVLFALFAFLWEFIHRQGLWFLSLLYMAEIVLIGVGGLYFSWEGELRMLLLPDDYLDPLVNDSKVYYSWYAFLLIIGIVYLFRNLKEPEGWKGRLYFFSRFVVLAALAVFTMHNFVNKVMLYNMEQDYYLRNEQWDQIINTYRGEAGNVQAMNILNLALAKKGQLGNDMFNYDQQGWRSLITEWDSSVPEAIELSDIFYEIGDIASAQKFAFEGFVSSNAEGNPRLLKLLVKTNLITGAYPVAEKYIVLLEQTLYYKDWARIQRRFLYNDTAVEQNLELGGKRLGFCNERFAVSSSVINNLEQLARNNPDNRMAMSYLVAFTLVNKDLKRFRYLLETYYKTKLWPELSLSHQEAVTILEPETPSYWIHHGVSLKVEQRFGAFTQDALEKRDQINYQEEMASVYGSTYWYYFTIKQ